MKTDGLLGGTGQGACQLPSGDFPLGDELGGVDTLELAGLSLGSLGAQLGADARWPRSTT